MPALVQAYQFIVLFPQADGFGMFKGVHAIARINPFDEVYFSVVFGRPHEVCTGFVERNGIEGGQDADVAHFRVFGGRIAVAVDRKVVGHADV